MLHGFKMFYLIKLLVLDINTCKFNIRIFVYLRKNNLQLKYSIKILRSLNPLLLSGSKILSLFFMFSQLSTK